MHTYLSYHLYCLHWAITNFDDANTEFGLETKQIKRLDYGLRVSAGYDLTSGLGLPFFYESGLATMKNGTQYISRNAAYDVSIPFLLNKSVLK
jgi:hypothetical protein